MYNKLRHFYWNKYIISTLNEKKYYISYDFKHKAIWYRVYKVGTRTIDFQFRENCNANEYIYSSAVAYKAKRYAKYFKFAFVRNPIDRFISAWKDKVLRQNYFLFDAKTHEQMKDISNFIQWVSAKNINKADEHIRAQTALIDINNIDYIGRFEHFEDDLEYVFQQIGIKYQKEVHINKTQNIIKTPEVSEEEKNLIAEIYKKDILVFYPEEKHRLS